MQTDYKTMSRADIIHELGKYFKLSEIVCPHTMSVHGSRSWQFFETEALRALLILRVNVLGVPLVCNTGSHTQRGYRCNLCQLVKDATINGKLYLTPHNGRGFDVTSSAMDAETMRKRIEENADEFPVPIRIEDGVRWLHIDTIDNGKGVKVYRFKA